MGVIILHLTLATQLDLDADVFGVCFCWVPVGIILHLTLATQLDLDANIFGFVFFGFGRA